jgi:hypothetical protein
LILGGITKDTHNDDPHEAPFLLEGVRPDAQLADHDPEEHEVYNHAAINH